MMGTGIRARVLIAGVAALAAAVASCDRGQKYNTNLLTNGSFEKLDANGVPKGWKLVVLKGTPEESEVRYGIDTLAVDGKQSWFFQADPGTRRFFHLTQEVEVKDVTHVRISGWIQTDATDRLLGQTAMCNFLLTFYDQNHGRFQELRMADKRTRLRAGTNPWMEENLTFRVPNGTRYVEVSCVLGMSGQAWFDNVSLSIPTPVHWETATTKNFVFHWLPGHPMPEGSRESQQGIFDAVAGRLGLNSDVVVYYYFYPDTSTIQRMMGVRGYHYVSWDDMEFHSINANDNHEVVHFITDPYGRPPRALAEGTVFWILDEWNGRPLDDVVRELVRKGAVPGLQILFEYNQLTTADPNVTMPMSAALVKFLVERWGTQKLMEFYAAVHGSNALAPVAAGFEKVYGLPMPDGDEAWRIWLKMKYGKS